MNLFRWSAFIGARGFLLRTGKKTMLIEALLSLDKKEKIGETTYKNKV